MKPLLEMTCYVVPVPQPRQRHTVVKGHLHNYTPEDHPVQSFKAVLRHEAHIAWGARPSADGPLMLSVGFYLPRPQRLLRKSSPDGTIPYTGGRDLNNLLKSAEDALSGLLWRNDKQICQYGPGTGKWYCEKDGKPRVEIVLVEVEDGG